MENYKFYHSMIEKYRLWDWTNENGAIVIFEMASRVLHSSFSIFNFRSLAKYFPQLCTRAWYGKLQSFPSLF